MIEYGALELLAGWLPAARPQGARARGVFGKGKGGENWAAHNACLMI